MDEPCCDLHNSHCEPPADLCCRLCTEARHPQHPPGVECVLTVAMRHCDSGVVSRLMSPSSEFVDGYNDALNDVEAVVRDLMAVAANEEPANARAVGAALTAGKVLRHIEKLRVTYGERSHPMHQFAAAELVSNPVTGGSLGVVVSGETARTNKIIEDRQRQKEDHD